MGLRWLVCYFQESSFDFKRTIWPNCDFFKDVMVKSGVFLLPSSKNYEFFHYYNVFVNFKIRYREHMRVQFILIFYWQFQNVDLTVWFWRSPNVVELSFRKSFQFWSFVNRISFQIGFVRDSFHLREPKTWLLVFWITNNSSTFLFSSTNTIKIAFFHHKFANFKTMYPITWAFRRVQIG